MIQAPTTWYSNKFWCHLSIANIIFYFSHEFSQRTPRFSKYFKNVSAQKRWGVPQITKNTCEDCVESLFWAHKSIESIYFWEPHVSNAQPTPKTREDTAFWRCASNPTNPGEIPHLPWLSLWNQWWNFKISQKIGAYHLQMGRQTRVFNPIRQTAVENNLYASDYQTSWLFCWDINFSKF